jgi:hypothetical protein
VAGKKAGPSGGGISLEKAVKEALNKSVSVIPAKAGIQDIQNLMDSRFRGNDDCSALP